LADVPSPNPQLKVYVPDPPAPVAVKVTARPGLVAELFTVAETDGAGSTWTVVEELVSRPRASVTMQTAVMVPDSV
jgi:hypothetical protein